MSAQPAREKDYLDKALDIAVRLAIVGAIVLGCFRIFSPFAMVVAWGLIIAVALYPIFLKLVALIGGRTKTAGTIYILLTLALVVLPSIKLMDSVVDGAVAVVKEMEDGSFKVPAPSDRVKEWPLIGERLHATWSAASRDLEATTAKFAPQLTEAAAKLAGRIAGLGLTLILMLFSLIISGLLMISAKKIQSVAEAIAVRLAGDAGPAMLDLSVGTIRSVVKGVLLVAVVQSLLSALGLVFAGVPAAGFWALLVLVLAIMQLPPILILGPMAIWVFSVNDSTVVSTVFLIWSLIISGSDGWLKPIFLGRGVDVPMLVILIGAIGGMLRSGVIGLFVGPVFLAIGYQLFIAWIEEAREPAPEEAPTIAEP